MRLICYSVVSFHEADRYFQHTLPAHNISISFSIHCQRGMKMEMRQLRRMQFYFTGSHYILTVIQSERIPSASQYSSLLSLSVFPRQVSIHRYSIWVYSLGKSVLIVIQSERIPSASQYSSLFSLSAFPRQVSSNLFCRENHSGQTLTSDTSVQAPSL